MLRYKTETRPGLVALYEIRPGNGAGPFLQPRSPHGARARMIATISDVYTESYHVHIRSPSTRAFQAHGKESKCRIAIRL